MKKKIWVVRCECCGSASVCDTLAEARAVRECANCPRGLERLVAGKYELIKEKKS